MYIPTTNFEAMVKDNMQEEGNQLYLLKGSYNTETVPSQRIL